MIFTMLFTHQEGERLESKLQIVLQSIIDNGINVKVKLKQRKSRLVLGALLPNWLCMDY